MRELWERLAERVFAAVPEMLTIPSLPDLEEGKEVPVRLAPDFNPLDRVLDALCLKEIFAQSERGDNRHETVKRLEDGRFWMQLDCIFFYPVGGETFETSILCDYYAYPSMNIFLLNYFDLSFYLHPDRSEEDPDEPIPSKKCSMRMCIPQELRKVATQFPPGLLTRDVRDYEEEVFRIFLMLVGANCLMKTVSGDASSLQSRVV